MNARVSLRNTNRQTLAAATPPTRDRFIDVVRAGSILVVVLGHWLMAAVIWNGPVRAENVLTILPALQPLTWLLQVMPLFFIVGGYANARSWRSARQRGGGYADFVQHRLVRLLRPVSMLLAVWLPLALLLDVARPGSTVARQVTLIVVQPLWFVGLYALVIALTPITLTLHRRFGLIALMALVIIVMVVDLLRLGLDLPTIGYLNYAAVWLFAHQLGYWYADGTLARIARRQRVLMAGIALSLLVALTRFGPYPISMVGLPGDRVSNMSPPSLALLVQTIWLLALALLLRDPIARLAQRPRIWLGIVAVNRVIMTIFLWHLTALILAVGVLSLSGVPAPVPATAAWWLTRPLWLALLALILGVCVRSGAWVELKLPSAHPILGPDRRRAVVAAIGMTYAVIGLSGLALAGLDDVFGDRRVLIVLLSASPLLSLVHIGCSVALLQAAVSARFRLIATAIALFFAVLALLELWGGSAILDRQRLNVAADLLTAGLILLTVLAPHRRQSRALSAVTTGPVTIENER